VAGGQRAFPGVRDLACGARAPRPRRGARGGHGAHGEPRAGREGGPDPRHLGVIRGEVPLESERAVCPWSASACRTPLSRHGAPPCLRGLGTPRARSCALLDHRAVLAREHVVHPSSAARRPISRSAPGNGGPRRRRSLRRAVGLLDAAHSSSRTRSWLRSMHSRQPHARSRPPRALPLVDPLSEHHVSVSSGRSALVAVNGCGSAADGLCALRERPALSGCSTPDTGPAT
jgi:hypothetical protein